MESWRHGSQPAEMQAFAFDKTRQVQWKQQLEQRMGLQAKKKTLTFSTVAIVNETTTVFRLCAFEYTYGQTSFASQKKSAGEMRI